MAAASSAWIADTFTQVQPGNISHHPCASRLLLPISGHLCSAHCICDLQSKTLIGGEKGAIFSASLWITLQDQLHLMVAVSSMSFGLSLSPAPCFILLTPLSRSVRFPGELKVERLCFSLSFWEKLGIDRYLPSGRFHLLLVKPDQAFWSGLLREQVRFYD